MSARKWGGSLKRYLSLAPNLPEFEQVAYAAALLQGDAYSGWTNMEAYGRAAQLATWTAFQTEFIGVFESVDAEESARVSLLNLKQT